jgi:hypothetical protein
MHQHLNLAIFHLISVVTISKKSVLLHSEDDVKTLRHFYQYPTANIIVHQSKHESFIYVLIYRHTSNMFGSIINNHQGNQGLWYWEITEGFNIDGILFNIIEVITHFRHLDT